MNLQGDRALSAAMPEDALVYVFSHGQFMQAARSIVMDFELTEREMMWKFGGRKARKTTEIPFFIPVNIHGLTQLCFTVYSP
ncbi:hypothetical protein [Granulicella mallensis]|uniref:Uncharacterized protein n=1 Tax=Granulicella mallensis TaxID=940614 RepID=A0A7W7ZPV0_9BACT|nr:hypothetical protein [Granulicella mallensis]MBB5063930.1 hypothetical protein [Granulicella mallensis]